MDENLERSLGERLFSLPFNRGQPYVANGLLRGHMLGPAEREAAPIRLGRRRQQSGCRWWKEPRNAVHIRSADYLSPC